jgi:hypothetical protein
MPPTGNYEFTVSLERSVEAALKKEQGKRQSLTGKRISINSLASEIITKAVAELDK